MTLLSKLIEAGWHEVEHGQSGKWAAERFLALPGASSSVLRVEAASSYLLNEAVSLRESQLVGASEPVKDTITNDGTLVTGEQHEALKVDGLAVPGAEQVEEPVPNEDEAAQESDVDASAGVVNAPQEPADLADLPSADPPENVEDLVADENEAPSEE